MSAKVHTPAKTQLPDRTSAPAGRPTSPSAKSIADRDAEWRTKKRHPTSEPDDGRLQPMHACLFVSAPDDPLEREADAAAAHALGPKSLRATDRPLPTALRPQLALPTVRSGRQAKITPVLSSGHGRNGKAGGAPDFPQRLAARRGSGAPIPAPARRYFSDRFRFNFDAVRVHTGHDAAALARAVSARAFTSGRDIVFDHQEYAPHTDEGLALLDHELAHVVQQSRLPPGSLPLIQRRGVPGQPDLVSKSAADIAASAAEDPAEKRDDAGKPEAARDNAGADVPIDQTDTDKAAADKKVDLAKNAPVQKDAESKAADATGKTEAEETDTAKAEAAPEPQDLSDLSSGELDLIDEELAEHQRWAGAADIVGAAGSEKRALFVIASAVMGEAGGFGGGFVEGAKIGGITRAAEYATGKAATAFAAKYAAKFGTQAAKFTPLPAVGAVIGGAISAYELIGRDWAKTGETIGRFGQGSETYERLANNIAAISEILDVATQVMNVIAGVIGAIAIASWAIAIATVGVASPLSATLTAIATGIGVAGLIIDAINAVVLKQLVVVFRALHAFSSDADPADVVVQGEKIAEAAGAASGFLGGFAGGMGASKIGKGRKGKPEIPAAEAKAPHPDHPNPAPATGEGPTVKGEPPVEGAPPEAKGTVPVERPTEVPVFQVEAATPSPAIETGHPIPAPTSATLAPKSSIHPKKPRQKTRDPYALKKGQTPGDLRPSEAGQVLAFLEIKEKKQQAERGGLVDEDIHETPGERKAQTRRGERPVDRTQYADPTAKARIEGWARETSRADFERMMQEAAADPSKGNAMTRAAMEFLLPSEIEALAAGGPMPGEFHHLLTVADFPEFAHKGEAGATLPKEVHKAAGHGGITSNPIEAATFVDPAAVDAPGFQIDAAFEKGYRRKFADIAAGRESTGNPLRDSVIEARVKARRLREKGGAHPSPRMRAEINAAEARLKAVTALADAQAKKAGTVSEPTQASIKTAEATPLPAAAEPAPAADTKITLDASKVSAETEAPPASPSPPSADAGPFPNLGKLDIAGQVGANTDEERKPGFWNNLGAFAGEDLASPSATKTATLAIGGPAASFAGWAGRKAGQAFVKARAEPVYERVNPHYPPPPGTVQDHVIAQNELQRILQERATVEAAEKVAAREEDKSKANQEPLNKGSKAAKDAISATEAHKRVVARHDTANTKADAKEKEVGALSAEFVSRSSRLVAVTAPMRAFERFTYLATYLPDSPDILKGAKKSILKVHSDAAKFLEALENVESVMRHQSKQQPQRTQIIDANATALKKTDQNADASAGSLHNADAGTQTLDSENKANLTLATQMKAQAAKDGQSLDAQAAQKAAQAEAMAAAWRSWSQRHRQARLDALEQTKKNMEQAGYRNIETREC